MTLSSKSWHYRLFRFFSRMLADFSGKRPSPNYPNQIDLCTYLRVILIKGPLIVAVHAALLALAVFVLLVMPIYYGGETAIELVLRLLTIILIVVGVILILAGVSYSMDLATDARKRLKERPDGSFTKVVKAWYVGIKEKTCVIFQVTE